MSRPNGRVARWMLLALLVVAGAAAAGVWVLRFRAPAHGADESGEVTFQVEPLGQAYFAGIVGAHGRLWLATSAGVVVVDPVTERWTRLYLDSVPVGGAAVIPCGSDLWLRLRDTLIVVDPETRRFQVHGVRLGPPAPFVSATEVRCAAGGLWSYDGQTLHNIPRSGTATTSHRLPPRDPRTRVMDFVEAPQGSVYFLLHEPSAPTSRSLLRFDPHSSKANHVELPAPGWAGSLQRAGDGILVHMYDSRSFLLRGEGQPWVEVPPPGDDRQWLVAGGDSVVWVGASYDVSPASYFVLRYIRDAMQPRDLVVLTRPEPSARAGTAVHYLGMLWMVWGNRLMRIDPTAEEVVRYALNDSTGALDKSSFPLTREGAQLRYFDWDTLRAPPGGGQPPRDSLPPADLGQEPEG